MEAVLLLAALVVLGALALRFGADSLDGIPSKEQELRSLGVTGPDFARDAELAAAWRQAQQGRLAGSRVERPRPQLGVGVASHAT